MSKATITETSDWEHQPQIAAKRVIDVGTDQQLLIDYDGRTDSNPVYVGTAAQGVTSAQAAWLIVKIAYDGSNRPVSRKTAPINSIWDNRASLSYG